MANMTKLEIGEKVEVLITKLTVMEEKIDHLTRRFKNANKKIEDLDTSIQYG
jgi:TusA-related sulfurtransferase